MKAGKKRRAKLPKWLLSRFDPLILQYRTDAESVAGLGHRITIAKNPIGFSSWGDRSSVAQTPSP